MRKLGLGLVVVMAAACGNEAQPTSQPSAGASGTSSGGASGGSAGSTTGGQGGSVGLGQGGSVSTAGSTGQGGGSAGTGGASGTGSGGAGGNGAAGSGGSAQCSAGHVCDGFEAADLGSWTKNGEGAIKPDATHVFAGSHAMQFVSEPGGNKRSQLERSGAPIFPLASGYGTERLRPQKGRDVALMSTSNVATTMAATAATPDLV